jgi:small GTP-binding protein
MWLFAIPALILGTRIIGAMFDDNEAGDALDVIRTQLKEAELEQRGELSENVVLVLGRTGAGKSSLINMVLGKNALPVGDIESTTRWLEAVTTEAHGKRITLVDSPGIGEAGTHEAYRAGLLAWYRKHAWRIEGVLVVLQADAKAHADDRALLDELLAIRQVPVLVVLNQADKIKPARSLFSRDSWSSELATASTKAHHVVEKLSEMRAQFRLPPGSPSVVPVSTEGKGFNRAALLRKLRELI